MMGDVLEMEGAMYPNKANGFPSGFKDYDDSFKRDEIPSLREDSQGAGNMTVPERIVLSAGYDGDDNTGDVKRVTSDIFGEQAIPAPDVAMVGMRAPPSTLTVDDSSSLYSRSAAGAGRTSDGDGSDRVQSPYRMSLIRRDIENQGDDRSSDEELVSDRVIAIGNENGHLPLGAHRGGDAFSRMQRKLPC